MAFLYPNGYSGNPQGSGQMLPIEQVVQRTTVARLHPEFRRRVNAMMFVAATQGVQLGYGTGWRVQPTNPDGSCKAGFACPGNSYHEGFMPDGVSKPDGVNDTNAMAADMVLDSSWGWMGANCHLFGLVDFSDVNGEPWHIQPVEIPRSRNRATAMPPLSVWNLPASPGGLVVTPEDLKILQAMEARIVAAVNGVDGQVAAIPIVTPWTADGLTPLKDILAYVMRNVTGMYLGEKLQGRAVENPAAFWPDEVTADLTTIKNILNSVSVEAIKNAVVAAIEEVDITVPVDSVEIAEAVAKRLYEGPVTA